MNEYVCVCVWCVLGAHLHVHQEMMGQVMARVHSGVRWEKAAVARMLRVEALLGLELNRLLESMVMLVSGDYCRATRH